jgi:glycosyltransferase involved in cell wall biosynthesis
MNILLVSTQDYIHHPVPSRHHNIFEELAGRHQVHVPHFHISSGPARQTRLIVHEATRFPVRNPLLHYTLNAPHHYRVFGEILEREQIDVVVAANILAGSAVIHAAKKADVPVIFDLKDWYPDSAAAYFKNRFLKLAIRKFVWEVTRRNLNASDRIVTVSPSLVARLQAYGFRSRLITNGVDTDLFRPVNGAAAREELGIGEEDFVIGFIGSLERWYAVDEIIRALPALIAARENTRFLVVGGALFTDYRDELIRICQETGVEDRVIFAGPKPYHELPRYISCMDVCTIPTVPEGWMIGIQLPNKLFEYSACGKPILLTPIPDVIRMNLPNTFVYRTRDEFISQAIALMGNPRTYELDLESFSWKRKAQEFESICEELLESPSSKFINVPTGHLY